ncbi:MAG TPA: hypothetical protein VMA34_00045, partial [Terracidiphilus sp.]|nr:hypothetical protein [Terracidiphilus sp.]
FWLYACAYRDLFPLTPSLGFQVISIPFFPHNILGRIAVSQVFSGQSLRSWRIVGQRYLSTRLSKGWQRSLLAVNRARRGKAAGHRPVLRGFPENVRNPDLPGVILVDDLDLACFVQVPQANCAGKQLLWLRASGAGGVSAEALQMRPKNLAPLFIFGRPEAQTDIWRWFEPVRQELKLRFYTGIQSRTIGSIRAL